MAKAITATKPIDMTSLTPGEYQGTWGGYVAKTVIDGEQVHFRVDCGIRAPSAPCRIVVGDGEVKVFAISKEVKVFAISKKDRLT